MSDVRHILGCMTGTSMDGLDAALVRMEGRGLTLRATLVDHTTLPLGDAAETLARLAAGEPLSAEHITAAARDLAETHLAAIEQLRGNHTIDLVAVHGQTIFHAPPRSWQLIDAGWIAHRAHLPVVFDLRAADLAAGGQGAPITPLADLVLFGDRVAAPCVVVNLGGFCNRTRIDAVRPEAVTGGDVCACNQLLNAIARRGWGAPFDRNGDRAATGRVDTATCEVLTERLRAQRDGDRSLGSGDEPDGWLDGLDLPPADLARTGCEAIAAVVGEEVGDAATVILAGGGALNRTLTAALRARCAGEVVTSEVYGVPVTLREAMAMAVLAAMCEDRQPITLPAITGCRTPPPVAGSWIRP